MTGFFKRENLPFSLILMAGFLVRVIGINFGLPDFYHADEPIIVNHAVAYGLGDFNPHFFKIPPLISYLLFISYGFYYVFGRAVGICASLGDFQNLFLIHPSSFYLIGRMIFGVFLGMATIYLFFHFIKRFFSKEHAFLSSFILAMNFLHVRDSHYLYTDIPLLLVLVACFFMIFRILEYGNWKDYLNFGLLGGAAVATKYNGVFIFIPFFAAHFLRTWKSGARLFTVNFLMALVTSLVAYSLLNPFSWLDFNFFLSDVRVQAGAEAFTGLFHHLTYSLNGALGAPVLVFSLIGILILIFQPEPKRLLLFSFVFVYYLVICFFGQPYDRYVLPLIPFFIFFATDVLFLIMRKLNLSRSLVFIFSFIFTLPSMAKVCFSDYLFLQKDNRTMAKEWIECNVPLDSKIAVDVLFYAPRLKPSLAQLREKRNEVLTTKGSGSVQAKRIELMIQYAQKDLTPRYHLFFMKPNLDGGFLFSKPAVPYNVESLRNHGIQYVILCQSEKENQTQFREDLEDQSELLEVFSPYKNPLQERTIDDQPLTGGPFLWKDLIARRANGLVIKIYRLK